MARTSKLAPLKLARLAGDRRGLELLGLVANGFARSVCVVALIAVLRQSVRDIDSDVGVSIGRWVLIPALGVILAALRRHERVAGESVGQGYANDLRATMVRRAWRAPLDKVRRRTVGALAVRMGSDLSAVRRWITFGLIRLVINGTLVVSCIGALFWLDWRIGSTTVVLVGAIGTVAWMTSRHLDSSLARLRRARGKLQSDIVERLHQLPGIRASGQTEREARRVDRRGMALKNAAKEQGRRIGNLRGATEAGAIFMVATALLLPGFSAFASVGVAELAAVVSLVLFMVRPISELARVQEYHRGARIALAKISAVLAMPSPRRYRRIHDPLPRPGRVVMRGVNLSPSIQALNATIQPGLHIGLCGPNGSGKSTLIRLAIGLVLPTAGRISLHGRRLERIPPRRLARSVGVAGTDYGLLRGTLRRNLTYRYRNATDAEISAVIARCGLTDLLARLPKGLQGRLNEAAGNLSTGERQRIGLARALLGEPPLLLLDEPDSGLDEPGRELLMDLLATYPGTIVLATHEQALLERCDQVWETPLTGSVRAAKRALRQTA